jgi:hypothetical protein
MNGSKRMQPPQNTITTKNANNQKSNTEPETQKQARANVPEKTLSKDQKDCPNCILPLNAFDNSLLTIAVYLSVLLAVVCRNL